jgi:ATP-dependent RNA helicase RhlE
MLDMGFIHDIKRIVAKVPPTRQTLLFSATMPTEIRRLADAMLRNPITVTIAPVANTTELIEQCVYHVEKKDKPALLAHLVKEVPMYRTIVFTRTKHGADRVVRHLHSYGIQAEAIHGNKSQNARQRALDRFKQNKIPVLVATDIASRGIDVDDVSHVVNYDLTHEPETYVHRIGRTGRAGAKGSAVSFCDREELPNLKAIEKLLKKAIPVKKDHPAFAPSTPEAERKPMERAPRHPTPPRAAHPAQREDSRPQQSRRQENRPGFPRTQPAGGGGGGRPGQRRGGPPKVGGGARPTNRPGRR